MDHSETVLGLSSPLLSILTTHNWKGLSHGGAAAVVGGKVGSSAVDVKYALQCLVVLSLSAVLARSVASHCGGLYWRCKEAL